MKKKTLKPNFGSGERSDLICVIGIGYSKKLGILSKSYIFQPEVGFKLIAKAYVKSVLSLNFQTLPFFFIQI